MNRDYSDIIDLPHHISDKHPPMPRIARAAQFAPFAAVSSHKDYVQEAGRLTEGRIEVGEDAVTDLDARLQVLRDMEEPEATFTFFKPDLKKAGGKYKTITGRVKRVDLDARVIRLTSGGCIPIDDILMIEGEAFAP